MSYSGLGQVVKSGTTATTKGGATNTSASNGQDRTASDWAAGLTAFAPLIGNIVGAATGQQQTTPAAAEPLVDPAFATAPASASPSWYWPVIIGVGVVTLGGIGYLSYNVKAPMKANRRRSRRSRRSRRMRRNGSMTWGGTPGPNKKLWIWSWVGGGWNSGFATTKAEATKLAKWMGQGDSVRRTLVPQNVRIARPGELDALSAGSD